MGQNIQYSWVYKYFCHWQYIELTNKNLRLKADVKLNKSSLSLWINAWKSRV